MKTNIIAKNTIINTIMKKYIKYLCAFLMIVGMSGNALGTMYIEYGGKTYNPGDVIPIALETDEETGYVYETFSFSLKNSSPGWTAYSGSYGFMQYDCYDSGDDFYFSITNNTYSNKTQYGTQYVDVDFMATAAGTYDGTLTIDQNQYRDGTNLQSGTFTIRVTVTSSCTSRTITMANFSKSYGDADFTPTHTVSAESGTKTWSSSNSGVATIVDGKVHIVGAGTTTIGLNVASSGDYCNVSKNCTMTVNAVAPTLSHNTSGKELAVSNITSTGVSVAGGIVTAKGGAAITKYGFVVGTSASVTFETAVKKGGGNGDVTLNSKFSTLSVSGLTPNTTYYVRAFAYNGTAYGYSTAVSFTTLQRYAVTYYKNDGSGASEVEYKDHGVSYTISSDKFTRMGYNLSKWHTLAAGTGGTDYAKSASYTTNAALDLYAVWTAATYTVTLNQNGGSSGSSSVTATYGEAMPSATMPTPPTGKTFAGYYYSGTKYYNADGTSAQVWDVPDDVTLTASYSTSTPTLTMASPAKVTINATSPALAEGAYTTVEYNTTVTLSYSGVASGYNWVGWNVYETGNSSNTVTVTSNQFTMPDFNVTVDAKVATDYVFSCAELTLSIPTPGWDTTFITSAAGMQVRAQQAFHVSGSGLTANTPVTFAISDPTVASKFAFKTATGGALQTDGNGAIDTDFYVYYTPAEDDTEDGLDKFTMLTASVAGGKPRTSAALDGFTVLGRHLPTNFVIAAKRKNKWYALPSDMATSIPSPVEIAVDNADNPTIAYTSANNMYSLYGQHTTEVSSGDGQYVKLAMQGQSNAPLFGSASTASIGKSSATIITNSLTSGYWWKLVQANGALVNPEDAVYVIYSANNSTNHLRLKENSGDPKWGLYDAGVEALRLIPASAATVVEAEVVEWGQSGMIVEVDAQTISATKVKGKLNGTSSSYIPLSQTLTSVKGSATKYDYTVSFAGTLNFAAAESNGAVLMLEWYSSSNVLVGVTSIIIPKIVATSATMSSINGTKGYWKDLEVHVLPGVTLTANTGSFSNAVTIRQLEIYPGATVSVTPAGTAGTLTVDTLVLRNGWTRVNGKNYDVARLYLQPEKDASHKAAALVHTVAYADWYIDFDQYYPVAVPWTVTTSEMRYKNTRSTASAGVKMRYYDGASRATNGQTGVGESTNWKVYDVDGKAYPATLEPSKGYAMTAKRPVGKAFSIVRMPLTIPSAEWTNAGEKGEVSGGTHKDQVTVTAHGKDDPSKPTYTTGWNFIANPYMSLYSGSIEYSDGTKIKYVNIPDIDFKEFGQYSTALYKLAPSSGFFVQAPETGAVTFGTSNRAAAAPAYRAPQTDVYSEQQAYIVVANDEMEDVMGLLISEKYTAEYELNADLEKLMSDGNSLRTYMRYGDMNMAYVAINEMLAKEQIPVSVRIPADGEYTFKLHNASIADALEGIYLIDYANGDKVTNLLYDSYVFTAEAGTLNNRFAINAIIGTRNVPTGADITGVDKNGSEPVKFIWQDKVYILHNNVIYDSTGKRVNVIGK